jgi:hypothetical protein
MPAFDPAMLRAAVMQRLAEHPDEAGAEPVGEAPEKKGIGIGPYAAVAGGNAADLISTRIALGREGAREGNPLLANSNAAGMTAAKAGSAALVMLIMRQLAKSGHPTAAKALGYGTGVGLGAVAAHNMTQGK